MSTSDLIILILSLQQIIRNSTSFSLDSTERDR